ncbi:CBS domain-containing protein [Actinoplanes aureus]|uniref:CBS domain-containing protein n=1 Tax=Actinoplanes aureus TaxID=2792083 RepID=A0A931CC86_9ACTN|nr:CBS domain-containing protein [Actinoplanes aureus]MBG0564787.1 CBS domain-containing protein [Actinoplanes aureus]
MQHWTVRDVMTNQMLTVAADARPAEVITVITTHDVSALAVVDAFDMVIGVLTRTDVLNAMVWREEPRRGLLARWRRAEPEFGWGRATADQMMSTPAVTVAPGATLAQAGRKMRRAGVKRLLVVDHRQRLLGVVAAADLLKVFGRSDDAVRTDVRAALEPAAAAAAAAVRIDVRAGVVTLTGRTNDRSAAVLLQDLAWAVPGVVDVDADLRVEPSAAAPKAGRADPDAWWVALRQGSAEPVLVP